MGRIILVTGGCRSGKSAHAQQRAEALAPARVYIATAPVTDDEMRVRIERHRQARHGRGWETVEAPTDLVGAIGRTDGTSVVLIDCLSLWVSNLMFMDRKEPFALNEDAMASRCRDLLDACRRSPAPVVLVTSEVGSGVTPENAVARRYRDLLGCCNRTVADGADEVMLTVCGVPMTLKSGVL